MATTLKKITYLSQSQYDKLTETDEDVLYLIPDDYDGAIFIPVVSSNGQSISWTNNAGLPNPPEIQVAGLAGPEGPMGPAGPQGIAGSTGARGAAGEKGDPGIPGEDGAQGSPGPQGMPGEQGPMGPKGEKGDQGESGVSGIVYRGPYYAGTTYNQNDMVVTDQGNTFVCRVMSSIGVSPPTTFTSNANWGPFVAAGAQGPQGLMGPQGPQGYSGLQGLQGPQGERGPQGFSGPQGPPGQPGPQGPVGPQGPQGWTGAEGEPGLMGPEGPRGLQGIEGPQGIQGPMGPQGEIGPQGPIGPQGLMGPQGSQGFRGEQGPQGERGAPGVSYHFRGVFSPQETYYFSALDAVVHNGNIWLALKDGIQGAIPPDWPNSDANWAPAGMAGIGPQGPKGPKGDAGGAVIYKGSEEPVNLLGNDGDLYFQRYTSSEFEWAFQTPGIYHLPIPVSGVYSFDISGAEGGEGSNIVFPNLSSAPGRGARLEFDIELTRHDNLTVIVGGAARTEHLTLGDGIKQMAYGYAFTAFIREDDSLWGVGTNTSYQLGLGHAANVISPRKIMDNVKKVACGHTTIYILLKNGDLYVCGANDLGQCGNGTTDTVQNPYLLRQDVRDIWAHYHTAACTDENGILYAWGQNANGEAGQNDRDNVYDPTPVYQYTGVVRDVAFGLNYMLVLREDCTLFGTGSNQYGQLGFANPDTSDIYTTVLREINSDVKNMAAGNGHTIIIKNDNTIWGTGRNSYRQAGNTEETTNWNAFTQIMDSITNPKAVAAGDQCSFLITESGLLYHWGYGANNRLGNGVTANITSATASSVITSGATDICYGWVHGGVRINNKMWNWGFNGASNQLGFGMTTTVSRPYQWVPVLAGAGGGATTIVKNRALLVDDRYQFDKSGLPMELIAVAAGGGGSPSIDYYGVFGGTPPDGAAGNGTKARNPNNITNAQLLSSANVVYKYVNDLMDEVIFETDDGRAISGFNGGLTSQLQAGGAGGGIGEGNGFSWCVNEWRTGSDNYQSGNGYARIQQHKKYDLEIWYKINGEWQIVGSLLSAPGPQGPVGPQGPQGPIGPQGLQGEPGPVGPQGPVGKAGDQGPRGSQGLTGVTGPQGPRGLSPFEIAQIKTGFAGTEEEYNDALANVGNLNAVLDRILNA